MQASFNSSSQKSRISRKEHFPYFKRFPHSRYLSQQKKRGMIKIQSISPQRSFKQPKYSNQVSQRIKNDGQLIQESGRNDSGPIIRRKDSKMRSRQFLRQILQRQTSKIRRRTQETTPIKFSIGRPKNFNVNSLNYALEGTRIIRNEKIQLTQLQKLEIQNYDQLYYRGQKCSNKIQSIQEMRKEDGGYIGIKGDHIGYRYEIIQQLGQGSFGQVFKCFDHKLKILSAIKLVKDNEKYTKQARTQIKILNIIKSKDHLNNKNCIHIKDFFTFRSRICMVFDLLSINLYELTKNNGYHGFPLDLIRRFVLQILNALHFLHTNNIIHADLKPENILLKQQNKSGLKIIDFGSSCFQNQTIYTYIQSRYYRAPEVILGLPYDHKIDIWSFGCIIAELHLGYPLFAGEDQQQQMCFIVEVFGIPPLTLRNSSKRWDIFFDTQNQLLPHSKKIQPNSKKLSEALQNPDQDFVEFIRACLQWVPSDRLSALKLLKNKWVIEGLPLEIKQQHMRYVKQEENKQNEFLTDLKKSRKHSFTIRGHHRVI